MKLFKKTFRIYVILTILGIVSIGLGCGISVFELSNYKTINYHSNQLDADVSQIEMHTVELEAVLQDSDKPFYLDATDWYFDGGYDIQYDNDLNDRVLIQVTAPADLYNVSLNAGGTNEFFLDCEPDEFQMIRSALALAKEGYLPQNYPLAKVKLTMSEEQAKNFQLNEMRDKRVAMEQSHQEELNLIQNNYQQQINDLNQQYSSQIDDMQVQHQEQIDTLQEQYEQQLNQKDEQIQNLQNQLNEARGALQ